jgi:4-hydroxybenzoate polyprenyltransferase
VWQKGRILYQMVTMRWVWLTLPFAFMGAVLAADGFPPVSKILWVIAAFMAARNAGMYINRLIDKPIDKLNPRTKDRALPRGLIAEGWVWGATILSFAVFAWAAYMLNPLCFYLSPLAMAAIILYPYAKRVTWGLHILLGFIMACAPAGAWIGISGRVDMATFVLAAAVLCWGAAFDVILDNQDALFYQQAGLHSLPARLGYRRANQIALLMHIMALAAFYSITGLLGLGFIYKLGLAVIALFLGYEYMVIFKRGFNQYKKLAYGLNVGISSLFFLVTLTDVLLLR